MKAPDNLTVQAAADAARRAPAGRNFSFGNELGERPQARFGCVVHVSEVVPLAVAHLAPNRGELPSTTAGEVLTPNATPGAVKHRAR